MPTIVVTSRDAQVTAKNREHAEDKISKLEKYFDGIGRIEAVLGHTGDVADVELVITVPRGKPIVCHSQAKELYAAIDLALDKAEAQLTKFKEKLKAHRADKRVDLDIAGVAGGEEEPLETYDDVIDKREFP